MDAERPEANHTYKLRKNGNLGQLQQESSPFSVLRLVYSLSVEDEDPAMWDGD